MQNMPNTLLGGNLDKNSKSWFLWVGVLLIIAACVFSYITTKPAEANVSFISEPELLGSSQHS